MTLLITGGAGLIAVKFILEWLRASQQALVSIVKQTYAGNLQDLVSVSAIQAIPLFMATSRIPIRSTLSRKELRPSGR